ncbi:MAG TPA: TetR family transcriptional regulator C-terminal domain-containing protein [Acidobacteriaceae bacterium]
MSPRCCAKQFKKRICQSPSGQTPFAGFVLNSWEGALLRSQADGSDAPLKDFLHFVFEEILASGAAG